MNNLPNYPIRLKPVCKEAIWGGHKLRQRFDLDSGLPKQAEAWVLTVRDDGVNGIENGPLAGHPLSDVTGNDFIEGRFPLLVKFLDAGDKLSIQVHPAKTEFWYIVDADPGAQLVYGLIGDYTEAQLREALAAGKLEDCLRKVNVRKGESYFIPTGLTHAIGGGILIAEIQENSNVTYRVYDYDRVGADGKKRQLHTDAAFAVMKNFTEAQLRPLRWSVPCERPLAMENFSGTIDCIAACPKFTVFRYAFTGTLKLPARESFSHLLCLGGNGTIGGEPVKGGDSFYLPAGNAYALSSESGIEVLESFVRKA